MKNVLKWYNIALAALLTVILLTSLSQQTPSALSGGEPTADNPSTGLPQRVQPVNLDRPFSFAGESVPTDNFDVRERLDRELLVNSYWHSSTLLAIKLSRRYFPIMEPILREEGVPDDFKYLAVAESSLRNAISPAGARGLWQFMSNTGSAYGLEINDEVDERFHVEKATRAACKYIKDYHKRFGSWTLAAAAYNMGGSRLSSSLSEQQAQNYYDLHLFEETLRYVFRVIALKEILADPAGFGFQLEDQDYYPAMDQYREVQVAGPVKSWPEFARANGTSYRMLKVYNPWLRTSSLKNKTGKTYVVQVPE